MSLARALLLLQHWLLALLLGLGPLGAGVLTALWHAQLCACCAEDDVASCCGAEEETPATERVVHVESGCPCSIVAPASTTTPASLAPASAATVDARAQLERCHGAVELARVEVSRSAASGGLAPSRPGFPGGPPGLHGLRGAGRAAALGVLRL